MWPGTENVDHAQTHHWLWMKSALWNTVHMREALPGS